MEITEAREKITARLSRIIGQTGVKRIVMDNLLGAVAQHGFSKPVLLIAPVGMGKSNILDAIKELNRDILGRKNLFFKTGKSVGTATSFTEDVLVPHLIGDANLIIDEFQDVAKEVMRLLRDLITVKATRESNTITAPGDYEVTYNPFMHGVVFATNEIEKVTQALRSRCLEAVLTLYNDDEMEAILGQIMEGSGIRFLDGTLRIIAAANRGTPRDIVHWSDAIRTTLAVGKTKDLTKNRLRDILAAREVHPLGLNRREVDMLVLLRRRGEMQLSELAGAFLCESTEQRAQEQYLIFRGLLGKSTKRYITALGRAYLNDLEREGYIPSEPASLNPEIS